MGSIGKYGDLAGSIAGSINPMLGLGITAGAGILDSIVNAFSASSSMSKQHGYNVDMFNRQADFSREMYDRQYQDSLNMYGMQKQYADEMYQRQLSDQRALIADERAYNDPSVVVNRLRAAGLNPKLALQSLGSTGNMSVSGVSAPSASVPSALGASGASSVSPVGLYQSHLGDSLVQYAQAKNLISSADYSTGRNRREQDLQPHEILSRMYDNQHKLLQHDLSREERYRLRTENSFLSERLGLESEEIRAQKQLLDAQFKVQTEQSANLAAERALMGKRFDEDVRVNDFKMKQWSEQLNLLYTQLAESKRQFDEKIWFEKHKWPAEYAFMRSNTAKNIIQKRMMQWQEQGLINEYQRQKLWSETVGSNTFTLGLDAYFHSLGSLINFGVSPK